MKNIFHEDTSTNSTRQIHLDYLRVVSIVAVIVIHVAAQNWYSIDVNRVEWQVLNLFDSMVRWAVPVFLMISGALFLQREISLKDIFRKNVFRMLIAFFVWSIIYQVFQRIVYKDSVISLAEVISGYFHMWFIPTIIGIYLCIPFIKALIQKKETMYYYLILSFIFAFLIPQIVTLANDFANEAVRNNLNALADVVDKMNLHMVLGYVCYFILGYCLNSIDINKKNRRFIYLAGMVGFGLTFYLTKQISIKNQASALQYYEYFTVNVLMESIAVFTFFKYRDYKNRKINSMFTCLSKYCFGVYLSHVLIMESLQKLGWNTLSFNVWFSVPLISLLVFVIALMISFAYNHIPLLKKYIV